MYNNGYYYITGEALDVDTLFRIRDHLCDTSLEEMMDAGYTPISTYPEIDWVQNSIGRIDYSFRWKVSVGNRRFT